MKHRHVQCEHKLDTNTFPQSPGLHIQHFLVSSNLVLKGASIYPWWESSLEILPLGPSPLYPTVSQTLWREGSQCFQHTSAEGLSVPSFLGRKPHFSKKEQAWSPGPAFQR